MAKSVSVGDKVTTTAEYDVNGTHLCSFVRKTTYDVIQVGGKNLPDSRIVIGLGSAVTAAVDVSTLTVVSSKSKKTNTTKKVTPKKPESVNSGTLAENILNNVSNGSKGPTATYKDYSKGSDSFVQEVSNRKSTTALTDKDYNDKYNEKYLATSNISAETKAQMWLLSISDPDYVQNKYGYPFMKKYNKQKGMYEYNYYMDYEGDKENDRYKTTFNKDMPAVRKSLNIDIRGRQTLYKKYSNSYNKYKLEHGDDALSRSFAHVFFVRPDCNILQKSGSHSVQLLPEVSNLSEFYYASKHCPEMLKQLSQQHGGCDHEFMLYPSNKVRSFQIADEYIVSDTYGQGLTGYKIPYGKDNVESRTAGKFSINYIDDRDLHIYNLHKLWIDYISYVYRGKLKPMSQYNINKVLDYATCVYYILCAEDGETIIFWSKYWGVFPLEAPSSSFSYTAENPGGIRTPELAIEYQYAWKEDFNPLALVEFNEHSFSGSRQYVNNYQASKLGTGYTWAGTPFIETFSGKSTEVPYTFKLRFRPIDGANEYKKA